MTFPSGLRTDLSTRVICCLLFACWLFAYCLSRWSWKHCSQMILCGVSGIINRRQSTWSPSDLRPPVYESLWHFMCAVWVHTICLKFLCSHNWTQLSSSDETWPYLCPMPVFFSKTSSMIYVIQGHLSPSGFIYWLQ